MKQVKRSIVVRSVQDGFQDRVANARRRWVFVLFLICSVLSGCVDLGSDSGAVSLSSVTCSGRKEISPAPGIPESAMLQKLDPEAVHWVRHIQGLRSSQPSPLSPLTALGQVADDVAAGSLFVAVIDHSCTLDRGYSLTPRVGANSPISESVMSQDVEDVWNSQGNQVRAHTWRAPSAMSEEALRRLAEEDPCLVSLSAELPYERVQAVTLNDTFFSELTHLTKIRAPEAYSLFYDATLGISQDVTIAIIDDGVQLGHTDLTSNAWTNTSEIAGNGIDDDANGYVDDINGWNFASQIANSGPQGSASHGTHVAGLAAASGGNGLGVAGVIGKNVKIMSLNVFGTGSTASIAAIINAINYAVDMGADVINLSLGGAGRSAAFEAALKNAVANGVTVVSAAGNEAKELTTSYTPAGYANGIRGMISVGSIDATRGSLSYFSNFSPTLVEIAAPGSDSQSGGLLSTLPTGAYGYKQGTSMATPVMSGAVALALSYARSRGSNLTPADMETVVLQSAPITPVLDGLIGGCRSLDLKSLADILQSMF